MNNHQTEIDALVAGSPYVAEAQKRARTTIAPPDAFLTADVYQILVTPRHGESYAIEMPWPAMISRRQTLDCLMDQVWADCSARVIFRPANAAPADVSEDFARDYARTMFEGGSDVEAVMGIKFIGRHLTNDQIEEICGG